MPSAVNWFSTWHKGLKESGQIQLSLYSPQQLSFFHSVCDVERRWEALPCFITEHETIQCSHRLYVLSFTAPSQRAEETPSLELCYWTGADNWEFFVSVFASSPLSIISTSISTSSLLEKTQAAQANHLQISTWRVCCSCIFVVAFFWEGAHQLHSWTLSYKSSFWKRLYPN